MVTPHETPLRLALLSMLLASLAAFLFVPAGWSPSEDVDELEDFPTGQVDDIVSFGGTGIDTPLLVRPGVDGEAYVLFEASGTCLLGPSDVNSKRAPQNLARLGSDMRWVWSQKVGDKRPAAEVPTAMCENGEQLWYAYMVRAGEKAGKQVDDICVEALDPKKNTVFSEKTGGPGQDRIFAMTRDGEGGAWLAGAISGTCGISGAKFKGDGPSPFFARFDSKGERKLVSAIKADSDFEVTAVSADGKGGAWAVGWWSGVLEFGDINLPPVRGNTDIGWFLAHIDSKGKWVTAIPIECGEEGDVKSLDTAADGSGVVGGSFRGTIKFGESVCPTEQPRAAFIARFNSKGEWVVATEFEFANFTKVGGVCITSDGSIGMGLNCNEGESIRNRNFKPWAVLAALTSELEEVCIMEVKDTEGVTVGSVCPAPQGGMFVLGSHRGKTVMGTRKLNAKGMDDLFVARFSAGDAAKPE